MCIKVLTEIIFGFIVYRKIFCKSIWKYSMSRIERNMKYYLKKVPSSSDTVI